MALSHWYPNRHDEMCNYWVERSDKACDCYHQVIEDLLNEVQRVSQLYLDSELQLHLLQEKLK